MSNREKIIKLRNQGLSYAEIARRVGCAKSTVKYNLSEKTRKDYSLRQKKYKQKLHPFVRKVWVFQQTKYQTYSISKTKSSINKLLYQKVLRFHMDEKTNQYEKPNFTVDDVIEKFGENPTCYLTGEPINIQKPSTYQFDHLIPKSRGGDNSLDNLGICTKQANLSKSNMTPDEFYHFCKRILEHQGYTVSNNE